MQQLYKSRKSKVIDGVCGGIAEYFKVDAVAVRLIWVIATIVLGVGFLGVIAYLIAAVIIPTEPKVKETDKNKDKETETTADCELSEGIVDTNPGDKELEYIDSEERKRKVHLLFALILIGLGSFLLIERFIDFSLRFWVMGAIGNFWPLMLVAAGIFLISRRSS